MAARAAATAEAAPLVAAYIGARATAAGAAAARAAAGRAAAARAAAAVAKTRCFWKLCAAKAPPRSEAAAATAATAAPQAARTVVCCNSAAAGKAPLGSLAAAPAAADASARALLTEAAVNIHYLSGLRSCSPDKVFGSALLVAAKAAGPPAATSRRGRYPATLTTATRATAILCCDAAAAAAPAAVPAALAAAGRAARPSSPSSPSSSASTYSFSSTSSSSSSSFSSSSSSCSSSSSSSSSSSVISPAVAPAQSTPSGFFIPAARLATAALSLYSPFSVCATATRAREEVGGRPAGTKCAFYSSSGLLVQQARTMPSARQETFTQALSAWLWDSRRHSSSELLQRAVRELPWGSREDLLRDRVAPVYVQEKPRGTPRREYNLNLIDGVRVRPTVNPYVKLTKAKRYVLDNWPSRNWDDWNPYHCYVRGSRKRYKIPEDLFPYKDELGEWHPPRLSARYKADVRKQYYINGLPWVWEKDFYEGKLHYADRELVGPKHWYRRAFRRERMKEALRKMDDLVFEYRKECQEKKKYDWFEKVVHDLAGEETATQFIRKRREPKF